jgi:hypothetical protein
MQKIEDDRHNNNGTVNVWEVELGNLQLPHGTPPLAVPTPSITAVALGFQNFENEDLLSSFTASSTYFVNHFSKILPISEAVSWAEQR